MGEGQKALAFYDQALQLSRAVSDRAGEARVLYHLARLERAKGELMAARSKVETALDIVESLRSRIGSPDLRAAYLGSLHHYYDFYVDLLMQLHRARPSGGYDVEAFKAGERMRARSLLELLTEAGGDIRQGVAPALVERESNLARMLQAKSEYQMRLLRGPHTQAQAAAASKETESLATEYQQVEAQIRERSPRYAALAQPRPPDLKQLQRETLDPQTLLLEYSLGDERSYLWAVTQTSFDSYELPGRAEIDNAARHLYELLTARNRHPDETAGERRARLARADAEYVSAATALGRVLLGPVAKQSGKKRLLVVGDGALQYLPFAALPEPAVSGASPAATFVPLVVGHEIVSMPSASTLLALRREVQGRRPAEKIVAVLADPVFDRADERVKSARPSPQGVGRPGGVREARLPFEVERAVADLGDEGEGRSLPRLPATRWEAEEIISFAPRGGGMKALDFSANLLTATGPELSRYRLLHFATHAFIDNVRPELSGIALSLVDERGEPRDGYLRAYQIFNLKLPAELVVLSACRTGLGKEIKGEGVVGLTRSFMYAGAARVVVSLWSLSDQPTAELMSRFYRGMLGPERLPPAAALRKAQVEMWKENRWPSPYFWAGFTLQGEWR